VDSIPTSAGKEDHVSMGPIAARKLLRAVRQAWRRWWSASRGPALPGRTAPWPRRSRPAAGPFGTPEGARPVRPPEPAARGGPRGGRPAAFGFLRRPVLEWTRGSPAPPSPDP
jgi:hypothetical protein